MAKNLVTFLIAVSTILHQVATEDSSNNSNTTTDSNADPAVLQFDLDIDQGHKCQDTFQVEGQKCSTTADTDLSKALNGTDWQTGTCVVIYQQLMCTLEAISTLCPEAVCLEAEDDLKEVYINDPYVQGYCNEVDDDDLKGSRYCPLTFEITITVIIVVVVSLLSLAIGAVGYWYYLSQPPKMKGMVSGILRTPDRRSISGKGSSKISSKAGGTKSVGSKKVVGEDDGPSGIIKSAI